MTIVAPGAAGEAGLTNLDKYANPLRRLRRFGDSLPRRPGDDRSVVRPHAW
jgi:hypothetical protein